MAIYRGAERPTVKTAGKQPKKVPSGSPYNSRKTARRTAETPEKHLFRPFFRLFFRPFYRHQDPLSTFFGCFQCRAFGTSVDGRRDSVESNRPLTPILLKSIAIHLSFISRCFLQKYALLLAESSIHTTNFYHDTPPICIAILLQKY